MELFDLHCDSITCYYKQSTDFLSSDTQFSLRELAQFDRMCQTMAVFIPDNLRGGEALLYFQRHLAYFRKLLDNQKGLVELVLHGEDIEKITAKGKCALLLSVEGGAALAGGIDNVDYLFDSGVRMMTLVWNGVNEIGSGHSTNKGITPFGKEVIRRMESKGIIVDVSHLNDRGFHELCQIAQKPFIATHSNLRAVVGHKRNLTNEQFGVLVRQKGLVGLNLHKEFLSHNEQSGVDFLYRHIYQMLELGGEDVIACGSDFDGADIECLLDSPVKFAGVAEYLVSKGISRVVADKIFFGNALAFFRRNMR